MYICIIYKYMYAYVYIYSIYKEHEQKAPVHLNSLYLFFASAPDAKQQSVPQRGSR